MVKVRKNWSFQKARIVKFGQILINYFLGRSGNLAFYEKKKERKMEERKKKREETKTNK